MIPEVTYEFMQAIMSPYYLWQSGSSGSVWRQTRQTGGVFLMFPDVIIFDVNPTLIGPKDSDKQRTLITLNVLVGSRDAIS